MEIYDECNNLRCRPRRLLWRFGREADGKWYFCLNGHPVVQFRVLPGGRIEFAVDHWWSLLVIHFPSEETLICRGTVRRIRPAQLKLMLASSRGSIAVYLFDRPIDLLRSGQLPIQIERQGFR